MRRYERSVKLRIAEASFTHTVDNNYFYIDGLRFSDKNVVSIEWHDDGCVTIVFFGVRNIGEKWSNDFGIRFIDGDAIFIPWRHIESFSYVGE